MIINRPVVLPFNVEPVESLPTRQAAKHNGTSIPWPLFIDAIKGRGWQKVTPGPDMDFKAYWRLGRRFVTASRKYPNVEAKNVNGILYVRVHPDEDADSVPEYVLTSATATSSTA